MAKCVRCQKRKGKRYCRALGDYLCSLCCGQIREKEIHCPPDCPYLSKHKSYQESRRIQKSSSSVSRFSPGEDILNDERLAWLVFNIEKTILEHTQYNDSFTDKEVLLALDYAKEKVEEEKSLFSVSEGMPGPQNELGEKIYKEIENARFEKRIIVPGEHQRFKNEEKIKCLDRTILSVKHAAQGDFDSQNYIRNLAHRFSRIKKNSSSSNTLETP